MSAPDIAPNGPEGPPSGEPTPDAARSLGSDGSDGDRKAASGVEPLRRLLLFSGLLLFPALATGEPPDPDPVGALRVVERASGKVADAAAALQQTAAEVAANGRLTALARLADQQHDLERALLRLQRAVAAAGAALPEAQPER